MATRKRAAKAAKKAAFPATIYVTRDEEGKEQYLSAWYAPSEVDEEQDIAVYELVRVGKLVITTEVK